MLIIELFQISDVSNSNQIRQTFNSPSAASSSTIVAKLRPSNVRRGRSQSQADLYLSSKLSLTRQTQHPRSSLNGLIDTGNSPSPSIIIPYTNGHKTPNLSKTPISSTTTALMMINKQYSNNSSTSLPPITNHHQHNTKTISFYEKRHCNHV